MTRIVHLARHGTHAEVGHVLSGRSEIALSERGSAEAEALARWLRHVSLASIHSSPRRRARDTAAPVATATGLPVTRAGPLDEIDFGAFTGRSFADLDRDPDWRHWNAERATARCPGGETMDEAIDRALAYLDALPDSAFPALCVSHCDIIRGVVARVLGLGLDRLLRFDCDPGSVTTLALDRGWPRVVSVNQRPR